MKQRDWMILGAGVVAGLGAAWLMRGAESRPAGALPEKTPQKAELRAVPSEWPIEVQRQVSAQTGVPVEDLNLIFAVS